MRGEIIPCVILRFVCTDYLTSTLFYMFDREPVVHCSVIYRILKKATLQLDILKQSLEQVSSNLLLQHVHLV